MFLTEMKNFVLIIVYLSITFKNAASLRSSNKVNLIADVVESYENPTSVTALVCWGFHERLVLFTHLINAKKPRTVRFVQQTTKAFDFASINAIVVVDLSCPNIRNILEKANKEKLFRNHYRWLFVKKLSKEPSATIPSALEGLDIFVDSEVIVINLNDDFDDELFLVYKIDRKSKWLIEKFGNWSIKEGLVKSEAMSISVHLRRKNLSNRPIVTTFAIINNQTKDDLADLSNPDVDVITTGGYRTSAPMFDFLNATRVNVFTDTWGFIIGDAWNGMVGDIERGVAEFAGTVMFITKDRMQQVHYLTDPLATNIFFVFREPPLSYQYNLFLLPFKATVWACIAAFALVLVVALYVTAQWEAKSEKLVKFHSSRDNRQSIPGISDVTMSVISAISQQGNATEMKGSTGRLVTFILFLTFLFLYTAYSASVVVLLQSSSKQIRTLSDLLNSKLELGVEETPYNRHYFTNADEPIRKAIYKTKVAPPGSKPNFMSLEDGVKKLQKNAFAFNMNTGAGYRMIQNNFQEHEKCGLQEISFLPPYKPWLSCKKDSPFKKMFQISLYRIREHGLSNREYRLVLAKKPECSARGGSFASVSLVDMYPALLLLLYGAVAAAALLAAEIVLHRRANPMPPLLLEDSELE